MDGSLKLLNSAWEGYILNLSNAANGSESLTNVITFLADNLDIIISVAGTAAAAFGAYRIGILASTLATRSFSVALAANPLGLALTGIVALTAAFSLFDEVVSETTASNLEASRSFLESRSSADQLSDSIIPLTDTYLELSGRTDLNTEEQQRLEAALSSIAKTVPQAVTEFDRYGKAISVNTKAVEDFVINQSALDQSIARSTLNSLESNLSDLNSEYQLLNGTLGSGIIIVDGYDVALKNTTDGLVEYNEGLFGVNRASGAQVAALREQRSLNQQNTAAVRGQILALRDLLGVTTDTVSQFPEVYKNYVLINKATEDNTEATEDNSAEIAKNLRLKEQQATRGSS